VTEQAGAVVWVAWAAHLIEARALVLERSGVFGKSFGRARARLETATANGGGGLSGNDGSARQKDYP